MQTEYVNDLINKELDALSEKKMLFAEDVYMFAKRNPNSELHNRFEWDETKAALEFNLSVARRLIQDYKWQFTTSEKEVVQTRQWVSIVDDRQKEGGYRRIQDVLNSKEMRLKLLNEAKQAFSMWRTRFIVLEKELKPVFDAMDRIK